MSAFMPKVMAAAKSVIYAVRPESFPEGFRLRLGYVFHTEAVFQKSIFDRHLAFLKSFASLTGTKPICTVMTPANARTRRGMNSHGVSDGVFVDRVRSLAEYSTLGYHGHFYFSEKDYRMPEAEIRCNNYLDSVVREQFSREVAWFDENGLSHGGIYAAGWWFMNAPMQRILMENAFDLDFSFSKSPWFHNPYSHELMRAHGISTGEPFRVRWSGREIFCVQNLVGCHTTPFPDDFFRSLRTLRDSESSQWLAVTNSHDFDLDVKNRLNCLEALLKSGSVEFMSASAIRTEAAKVGTAYPIVDLGEDA